MNLNFWRNLTGAIAAVLAGFVPGTLKGQTPIVISGAPGISITLTNRSTETNSLQWFKDGIRLSDSDNITGATGQTLVIGECSTDDTGYYLLRGGPNMVTNAEYSVSINVIQGYVVVNVGDPILLRGSDGAYNYKWLKDGRTILFDTNVFSITYAQSGDSGIYELQCGARRQLINARFLVHVIGPYISDFRYFYSSPYLLDFNFFLRDENNRAITNDPSLFGLTCWEDDEHISASEISPSETGARLLRANKQLECFVVLDYTRSMTDPVRNGDADQDFISDSVENMEAGAKTLIGTLPIDAKIGLFEFHRADAEYPPQKVANLMRDKAYLTNTIDQLWSSNVWTSGASRCWDALYKTLQEWPPYNLWDDQRFIVFISDGRDESSTHFPTNVVSLALTNNVKIYCIGYGTELTPGYLSYITSQTGGQYYPAMTPAELVQRFQQIAIDMRSQYIVRWATLKRNRTFPPPIYPPDYYFIPKFQLTYGPYTMTAAGNTNHPYLYEGDELVGRLHFATSLDPGDVASLVLRADYIPRGVTRIRVNFASVHDFSIERIPFSEGGVCPDNWTFTTNLAGEISYFEFSSTNSNDPFTALPFAALGKLVEFKFQGVTNLMECFSQVRADNSFYSWPGGPTLVIDNAAAVGGEQVYEKDVYYVPGTTIYLQVPGDDGSMGPYQWSKDGTDLQDSARLQGSQTNSLVIQNCRESDSGSYILTGNNVTKAIFRVHVLPVETETIRLTNAPGVPLMLTNRSEVSYNARWSRNGFALYDTLDGRITGAGTPTLKINECSQADSGVYVLTSGSPVRTNAVYDVQIETLRFSTNVAAGTDVTLSGGPGGFKYQWFKDGAQLADGNRISGSTTPDLVIRALQPGDFGTYTLQCGTLSRYENAVWELSVSGTNAAPTMRISGLRPFYSSPYLLDFNFFIRNITNDNAATLDLAQLTNIVCKEDGQPISPSETGYRLMPENKQLEGFVVLDYTMSMLNLTQNGDQNNDSKSDSADQMEIGAKALIGALPGDAKIGLFEFHRGDTNYPPQKLTDLIRDKTHLTNQIDQIWTNVVWSSGSSRCWDALHLALQAFPTNNPGDNQRFLVFLSDGKDESSTNRPEDVIALAQTNNVKICCIGYGRELDPTDLTRITTQTEGWYYATTNAMELAERFSQIATNLSSQYILRWATLKRTATPFIPSFQLTDLGLVASSQPYTPTEHQGDELQGHLWFDTCLNPSNVASLVLRASYVPRGVTRIRVDFASAYEPTIERIPFSEGGVCPDDWTFATNWTGGFGFFEFSSTNSSDPFTALPFATLGKLVEFKLKGVTNLSECFTGIGVDNSKYSQPGGPTLIIDGVETVGGQQVLQREIYAAAGTTISLDVPEAAETEAPYQWSHNGTDLQDGDRISGSRSTSLTILNCAETDAGSYMLTDQVGTKAIFLVHVIPPEMLIIQLTNAPGTVIELTNRGAANFTYQWSRNGVALQDNAWIRGSITPTLRIKDCLESDAGFYLLTSGPQPVRTNAMYEVHVETIRFLTNRFEGEDIRIWGAPGGHDYQWYKDADPLPIPLVDGNRIIGSTNEALVIRALQPEDSGTYRLRSGNSRAASDQVLNAVWDLSVYVNPTNKAPDLRITGLRSYYSSPYLLDFDFFIRDRNDRAVTNVVQLTDVICKEDGQAISASETGYRLMPENKQLECFVVLDYTMSMLNVAQNGDQNSDSKSDSADQMELGAKTLISALPRDAKIGLFEFHRGDTNYPPQKVTELIRDKGYLTNQIDQLWSNVVWSSGSSRCWDALHLALQAFPTNNPADNQRFLVFLSDGKDESSRARPEDVIALAQTNNVKICSIGYGNELNPTDLTNITTQTEGWYYRANDALDLTEAFKEIATNLSSQYILRWATLRRTDAEFTPSFQLTDLGLVATNQPYNPAEHPGNELQGHLWFDTCLDPNNVASLVLRASYVPRGVTRIRIRFATTNTFEINRITFTEGGLCPDAWTTNLLAGETNILEFSSPDPTKPFSALPFATLGKLAEFKLYGITDLQTCFSYLDVDNSLYPQPGGPSFTINGPGSGSGGGSGGMLPPRIISFVAYTAPNTVSFEVVAEGDSLSYQWMWQGQDIPGATENTLSFTNAQATANAGYYSVRVFNLAGEVTSPPPGSLFQKGTPGGTYKGIFCDSDNPAPETSGSLQFTLSGSKRTFSGKGLTGKAAFTFSGTFSEDHSAIVQTRKPVNGTPLILQFQLLTTNNLPGIMGTVGNGWWAVPLRGERVDYTSRDPAPQAGKYTLALVDLHTNLVGTLPNGCSFVSVVVNKQGGVVMKGLAADGIKLSSSTSLSRSGHWPIYVSLYKNQGCVIGWLQFTNTTESAIQGESLFWVKNPGASTSYPDGFSSSLEAIGSTFSTTPDPDWAWPPPSVVNVLPFTDAVASLAAGDMFSPELSAPVGIWTFINVSVPSPNRLLAEESPEKLRLSVTTGNGTLAGSFTHPMTGLRVPIRGIILQEQQTVLGYFLSRNCSGYFSLSPRSANP